MFIAVDKFPTDLTQKQIQNINKLMKSKKIHQLIDYINMLLMDRFEFGILSLIDNKKGIYNE